MARSLLVHQAHTRDYLLIQTKELVIYGLAFFIDKINSACFKYAFFRIVDVSVMDGSCQDNTWTLV